MRPLAEALGPGLPLIALNGALILDGTDRIIQQRALSPAALATLATLLAEAPALLHHDYCGRHWYYADPTHPRCRRETAIIGLEPEPRPAAPGPAHKVLLLGPAVLISHWAERLGAALPTLNVQRSKADYLEITAAGAAEALRWLCARRGWNPARVLALGDGDNDRPLLKAAGHGVALAQPGPPATPRCQLRVVNRCDGTVADGVGVSKSGQLWAWLATLPPPLQPEERWLPKANVYCWHWHGKRGGQRMEHRVGGPVHGGESGGAGRATAGNPNTYGRAVLRPEGLSLLYKHMGALVVCNSSSKYI